jgi:hypothetical protein
MKIQVDGWRGVGFLCEAVFCETTGGEGLNLRRIG